MKINEIISGILRGDKTSISRAISIVEGEPGSEISRILMEKIYKNIGNAHIVGITGPPGIGKSTMIGRLAEMIAKSGKRVSIVAIDASSPFSGGAFLGNRIRMQESLARNGIFMRSIASRGMEGGLTASIWETVKILDAGGSDYIIVETVGAGQSDIEVVNLAHTVVVVLGPGLGDQIQALKAGIMEIASIFVVNKIDLPGAYIALKDIQDTLAMSPQKGWKIPVLGVNSLDGTGYEELISRIGAHMDYIQTNDSAKEEIIRKELKVVAMEELRRTFERKMNTFLSEQKNSKTLLKGGVDIYSVVDAILHDEDK